MVVLDPWLADKEQRDWLERYQESRVIHQGTYWLGHVTKKCPTDAWIYQELIYATYPSYIIETGTGRGGSALFLASICDLVGYGQVITIDIKDMDSFFHHPRITKIIGSSVESSVVDRVNKMVSGDRVMVVLDSLHTYDHVLAEIKLYAPMIKHKDLYLIVEDSYLSCVRSAIADYLLENENFVIDRRQEKFGLTFHPSGYLRCK